MSDPADTVDWQDPCNKATVMAPNLEHQRTLQRRPPPPAMSRPNPRQNGTTSRQPTFPIKILHVVLSLEPGGLENGVVNVARALNPDEFQLDVCCLHRAGKFADRLPSNSNVFVLGKGDGFSLRTVYDVARVVRLSNADVLHTHNLGNLIYGSFATGFSLWRPILHSEHGDLTPEELGLKRLRQRRFFYRFCRKVHTVSNDLRERLIGLGFEGNRICALANGVDTARFCPADQIDARQRLGLDERGPVIGIVDRFIASKRHHVLLEAFEAFAAESTHAQLLMVGSGGSEQARITELVKTSPHADRIHLAGYRENPWAFYQAMDLLVLPSTIEGMSNTVLEGMACGVPALSHASCGTAEIIESGENGFVSELQTPARLIEQMRMIFSSPERLKLIGRNARETVLNRFALGEMVRQFRQLYLNVAS
jgi:glycosyltransferase involved in cell wall biosynthesis